MTKHQFQTLLQEKGIQAPPLPPDDVLPPEADIEEYLAQVFMHCARVERKIVYQENYWVFEVSIDKQGKFRGSLQMQVEPVMEVVDETE